MRGSARIYDVRMAQFVLKIEKLSHIIGARGSQDLRSPYPIMAPDLDYCIFLLYFFFILFPSESRDCVILNSLRLPVADPDLELTGGGRGRMEKEAIT